MVVLADEAVTKANAARAHKTVCGTRLIHWSKFLRRGVGGLERVQIRRVISLVVEKSNGWIPARQMRLPVMNRSFVGVAK